MSRLRSGMLGFLLSWCVICALAGTAGAAGTRRGTTVRILLRTPASVRLDGLATFTGTVAHASTGVVEIQLRRPGGWQTVVVGRPALRGGFDLTWIVTGRAGSRQVRAVLRSGTRTLASSSPRVLRIRVARSKVAVSPRTQVLSAATVSSAPAPGRSGALVYAGGDQVSPGQIIAIGQGPNTPDGFLGEVTSVSTQGGDTVANTRPAALEQAVHVGSFDESFGDAADEQAIDAAATRAYRRALDSEVDCQGSASAELDPSLKFGTHLDLSGDWDWNPFNFGLKSALTATADATASLTATVSGSGSCSVPDTTVFSFDGPSADFTVGPVPVFITSDIDVDVDADVSVGASTTTGVTGGFSATAGIGWKSHGGFYGIHTFNDGVSAQAPTVTAQASVAAHLTPTINVDLYGVAGPQISLSTGLEFDADTTQNPWWTLTSPVALTGDLAIPALGLKSSALTICKHTFTLAQAGGPFSGGSGSGGSGSGGSGYDGSYVLSIFAGTGGSNAPTPGPATHSSISGPEGVAVDSEGDLFIADTGNNEVEEVTPAGQLSIIAGDGDSGTPTPGLATDSALAGPEGVSVNSAGDVFIADTGNNEVEEVTPAGQLSIIAGDGDSGTPTPGLATDSALNSPTDVRTDDDGNTFIADSGNNEVEQVSPAGQLTVVAGDGEAGAPTPGPAIDSSLDAPVGLGVDAAGDLYIADADNADVEEVTPSGQLSVIAGTGTSGAPTPGAATDSALGRPTGVRVDAAGDIFIADAGNDEIDEVNPSGQLSVIAGTGDSGASTPGSATSSELDAPIDVAVASGDLIYIADADNNEIEKLTPES